MSTHYQVIFRVIRQDNCFFSASCTCIHARPGEARVHVHECVSATRACARMDPSYTCTWSMHSHLLVLAGSLEDEDCASTKKCSLQIDRISIFYDVMNQL